MVDRKYKKESSSGIDFNSLAAWNFYVGHKKGKVEHSKQIENQQETSCELRCDWQSHEEDGNPMLICERCGEK